MSWNRSTAGGRWTRIAVPVLAAIIFAGPAPASAQEADSSPPARLAEVKAAGDEALPVPRGRATSAGHRDLV